MNLNPLSRASTLVTDRLPLKTVRSRLERPLASITFDDFPQSAWTVAGPILDRFAVKATYYAAARFCGAHEDGLAYYTEADLIAVRRAGHEIGTHSYAHQMAPAVSSAALEADLARNAEALAAMLGGVRLSSYAYPYGEASPRTKALMARRFATARGIRKGVNAGVLDLAQLMAVPLEARRWRPDELAARVEAARARNGWLILFTHDVSEDPSPYGCTPAMLTHALELLAAAQVAVLPVKHAMAEAVFGARAH